MKRLIRKSNHDIDNRWLAMIYINGEIYTSSTHAGCLKEFMDRNDLEYNNGLHYRKDVNVQTENLKDDDIISEMAYMHLVDDESAQYGEEEGIYIEVKSVLGISLDNLVNEISLQYPQYKIFNDCNFTNKNDFEREYERIL